jgi:Tfp pilus assembly protein PilN
MGRLRLDYQRPNRPVPWLGVGVLAASLAAGVLLLGHYQRLNRQVVYWEGKIEHIERQSRRLALVSRPLSEQDARAQVLEVTLANRVVRQLNQPWNALFNAVETAGGQGIALLSMEPDLQKGTVAIGGEAKDLDALLKYVRQLAGREVFASVLLQNHQVRVDDPEKPLRFSLLATWKQGGEP